MWIVINIGCLECGVSTKIVGIFANESEAESVAVRLRDTHSWREHGQNDFEVFELPAGEFIDPEYVEGVPVAE